jgi:hypothetical protein
MKSYIEFLKHLDINTMLMKSDIHSRLPDSEKPMFVSRCKEFEVCERVKNKGCSGCNVWNYLYDITALQKWCKEHDKNFVQYALKMERHLKESIE